MEPSEIKNIGTYFEIDNDGFIINPGSIDLIQNGFKKVLDLSIKHIKKNAKKNLHSIYVRGSVAKGTAIENISDIDLIIVVKEQVSNKEWKKKSQIQIIEIYPFVTGVEFHFETLGDVLFCKEVQFLLQTQSIKVYGEEINFPQQSFSIGESYAHLPNIENDFKEFYQDITSEDKDELLDTCSWIARRIVRTGFEIVMKRENLYTRDLYPCYKSFVKYYPEKKKEMEEVLKLAVFPSSDKEKTLGTVKSIESFIVEEAKKIQSFGVKCKNINIRQAAEKDIQDIINLYAETVRTVNAKDYKTEQIEVWAAGADNFENWKRSISEQYFLVAEINNKIVGLSSITENGYLDYMYVHKDYQRIGVAKSLLHKIEMKARAQNNNEIFSHVSKTAKPFFEKFGYKYTGVQIDLYKGIEFINNIMKKKM